MTSISPLKDPYSEVILLEHCGGDETIAAAARVSYAKDTKNFTDIQNKKLIKYMLEHEHGSPFEHTFIKFRVVAPLYVVQEMLRHRIGVSYNQQSARYTEFEPHFYTPLEFRESSPVNKQSSVESLTLPQADIRDIYFETLQTSYDAYKRLLHIGVAKEQARGVLPHCTYTSLYITFNLRSLLHFLKLRLAPGAQWETQQYAKAYLSLVKPLFPLTFESIDELNILYSDT